MSSPSRPTAIHTLSALSKKRFWEKAERQFFSLAAVICSGASKMIGRGSQTLSL